MKSVEYYEQKLQEHTNTHIRRFYKNKLNISLQKLVKDEHRDELIQEGLAEIK